MGRIVHRSTGAVLFEDKSKSIQETLMNAAQREVDLSGANLSGLNLSGVNLEDANLREVDLRKTDLRKANLREAVLWRSSLDGANLSLADLRIANLGMATLSGAYLLRADLSGADLEGADLEGAYIFGANLEGVDIVGANLRFVRWDGDTVLTNILASPGTKMDRDLALRIERDRGASQQKPGSPPTSDKQSSISLLIRSEGWLREL